MSDEADFKAGLLNAIPNLRAFGRSLCGDETRADDLVQDTLMKAWAKRDTFQPNTNQKAWLFTILRNAYFSEFRKRRRETDDPDNVMADNLAVVPAQQDSVDLADMVLALNLLPKEQREALLLISAEGFSYDEAAVICDCAVGTVKSRVNRARKRLAEIMGIGPDDTFGMHGELSSVHLA
ncbi:MAG: sigma-70 family RNA polymerase sigma factor [Pseudomonadota bacterium]